jgi:uncharacterized protein (TIGR02300 family)
MAAKDLGNKFICFKCSTKFYDLKKPDPICPKCGTDQRDSPALKPPEPRRGRLAAVPKVIEPIAPEEPEEASEEEEAVEDVESGDDEDVAAGPDDEEP